MNQVILVGKVARLDKQAGIIMLQVNKNNNNDGVDLIPLKVNEDLLNSVIGYIKDGMTVGIKGYINTSENKLLIVVEKLTFISNKKNQ